MNLNETENQRFGEFEEEVSLQWRKFEGEGRPFGGEFMASKSSRQQTYENDDKTFIIIVNF